MKYSADIFRPYFPSYPSGSPHIAVKIALVATVLLVTSGLRWVLDPYLGDELPFFLYLPGILIIAVSCGFGAGLATLVGSSLLTVILWTTPPAVEWWRLEIASALGLGFRFLISSLLLVAIALLQNSAAAQRELLAELNRKSEQLEEKSARLELSEKKLAAHAENLERLVAERTAKLEETVGELQEFSYTISHDLRSPLRAMQGFAHLLRDEYGDRLEPQGREYLQRIDHAAQRLDTLIHDVLSYSSLGRAEIELQPVNLDATIEQVVSQYPMVKSARPLIEVARPLLPVMASESCLVQALSNLIQNALKFVGPTISPRVKIWTEPVGPNVKLHVRDEGIGIPAASLANLFKPFYRGHPNARYEGTGIGLAIVKRAVERQGGTVGVSSEPGKGSDFWIELPQATQTMPPLP